MQIQSRLTESIVLCHSAENGTQHMVQIADTIVEYMWFFCRACGTMRKLVNQIRAQMQCTKRD